MATDTEDPDAAADRLEAALERIATRAAQVGQPAASQPPAPDDTALTATAVELAARLDDMIDKLRAALAGKPA